MQHEVADYWGGDEAGNGEDVGDGVDVLVGGQGTEYAFWQERSKGRPVCGQRSGTKSYDRLDRGIWRTSCPDQSVHLEGWRKSVVV